MTMEFFNQLSLYYNSENDLSNVTCALCNSSMWFKERFVHFFFPQLMVDDILSIEREVCDDRDMHSRVDLMIRVKDDPMPWLIEIKIYDQNHHFGQYETAYDVGRERLGYITNYFCKEGIDLGYDVKTWDEWSKVLKDSLSECGSNEETVLCEGYIEYVNKVCGLSNIVTTLCFDENTDLVFNDVVCWALNLLEGKYRVTGNRKSYSANSYNIRTFEVRKSELMSKKIHGWVGYVYHNQKPLICMGFCKYMNDSKIVYDALTHVPLHRGGVIGGGIRTQCFNQPSAIIPMCEEMHQKFLEMKSRTEQIDLMKSFIEYCFCQIEGII